jgi:hypothetical protein
VEYNPVEGSLTYTQDAGQFTNRNEEPRMMMSTTSSGHHHTSSPSPRAENDDVDDVERPPPSPFTITITKTGTNGGSRRDASWTSSKVFFLSFYLFYKLFLFTDTAYHHYHKCTM